MLKYLVRAARFPRVPLIPLGSPPSMPTFKPNITIRGEFCIESKPESCAIVIFGASGDLTARKLIPSLFNLWKRKLLAN
jgi:hypothetical protein